MLTFGLSSPLGVLAPASFAEQVKSQVATTKITTAADKITAAEVLQLATPQDRQCTQRDGGGFIWIAERNGVPGHWERLRAGIPIEQQCTGGFIDGSGPTVRDHSDPNSPNYVPQGGVSVTTPQGYTWKILTDDYLTKLVEFWDAHIVQMRSVLGALPVCSEPLDYKIDSWDRESMPWPGPQGATGVAFDFFDRRIIIPSYLGLNGKTDSASIAKLSPFLRQHSMLPFTFGVMGVPFLVTEIGNQEGQVVAPTRRFQPGPTQAWLIQHQIVAKSMANFADADGRGDALDKPIEQALQYLQTKGYNFVTHVDGFMVNPAPPISPDVTLRHYLDRGGYLIDFRIIEGKEPAALTHAGIISGKTHASQGACAVYCKDSVSGLPYCAQTLPIPGVDAWNVYTTMDLATGTYQMTLKPYVHDNSWWETAVSTVAGLMKQALEYACSADGSAYAQAAQQAMAAQAKAKVDEANKNLATAKTEADKAKWKAEIANWSQYASVYGAYAAAGQWVFNHCQQAFTPPTPIVPQPPPPVVDPPPPDPGMPWWQWGLIISAGVGALYVGKTLIARRG